MALVLQDLTAEALKLPEGSRARLASILLESLDFPYRGEPLSERRCLEEANRRDQELRSGTVKGRPWEEVLAQARARLQ